MATEPLLRGRLATVMCVGWTVITGWVELCPAGQRHGGGQDLHEPVGVHLAGVSGMGDDEQEAAQLSCGRADFGFCQGSVPV